jgi:tetratricopeptide (TPR) repeat protein
MLSRLCRMLVPARITLLVPLCIVLCMLPVVQAEPRPEAYWAVPDHYAEVRTALQAARWPMALEALQQLSHRMPSVTDEAEFHNLMGFTLRQSGPQHLGRAVAHYQQALRFDPGHVQAREYLGQAFLMQGRADLAREQLGLIEKYCKGQQCPAWEALHHAIQVHAGRP